ncbi:hypothetical protein GCM10011352_21570 [Marinobacterium zhoushanense]|uniref:Porin domain-containing protein n=1 Tax=Marinobacterium zhoushanense TaxID=1679163 RepID=A0ABQ1KD22_9GAMM|nr:porin [Marinobacterium zhoushanense]GGB95166.1 hypothetical protein GCM10011352_21570 [Marinobacterium zhoushanense]
MKKSLIALAVAGAMAAPMVAQADATLYGKFEMRLKNVSGSDTGFESDDFRVGLKGDVDLGLEDTKGIFKYETEINPNIDVGADTGSSSLTTRDVYMGATGSWGTALVGQFGNPAEKVIGYIGNLSESASGFAYDLTPDRLGNAAAYVSPSFGGVTLSAGVAAQIEGDNDFSDADAYVVTASYEMGGLSLTAGYWDVDSDYSGAVANYDWAAIGGSYTLGSTTLGLAYQSRDENTGDDNEIASVMLTHSIDALTLGANYHSADDEDVSGFDDEYSLFAIYSLGKMAALDAEFVSADTGSDDVDVFSVGYTLKF